MKKVAVILTLIIAPLSSFAQQGMPISLRVAYIGEFITHPGLKIGADYHFHSKIKFKKDSTKRISYTYIASPAILGYYHHNYQTGLQLQPELILHRKNQKGCFKELSLGFGLLKTYLPNVYALNSNNQIEKSKSSYNFYSQTIGIAVGQDMSYKSGKKYHHWSYYFKPQMTFVLPSQAQNTKYFFLEIGINHYLGSEI